MCRGAEVHFWDNYLWLLSRGLHNEALQQTHWIHYLKRANILCIERISITPFVFVFFFNFQKTTLISLAPPDQLGSRTESTGDLWGLEWAIKSQGTWQGAADWASTSCMPSWILSVLLRLSNCFPEYTGLSVLSTGSPRSRCSVTQGLSIHGLVWPLLRCLSGVSIFFF